MERDDVHAIITGTPDHWHTFVNLLAVKTGKDVYTEKPLTLTIDEGKRLVKAVRDNKRIVQVGSQQRSDRNFRLACELVRNGRIGKLQHIIVGLPTGPREGPFSPIPVPPESNDHMGNFFECIRSRKAPICEAEIGHRSISVAHMGVISARLELPLQWDPDKEVFVGENAKEGNKWLAREMRKPYDYS